MLRRLHNAVSLERTSINGRRYYHLPESDVLVPSVTTILYKGKEFPNTPKMTQARNRGEAVHELVEHYLLTGEVKKKSMPANIETFQKFRRAIDQYLSELNIVETQVYSHKLLTAGTVDCVGIWDGQLSVIDWKTSLRHKKPEYVEDYKIQAAVYAQLVRETHQVLPLQGVIVVANDEDQEAQVFKFPIWERDMLDKVERIYVKNRR